MNFEYGALYNRKRDIHGVYKGQERGGIATPDGGEFIFLFTGEAGVAHGYHDFSDDEGFHLYGEGQNGDMVFVRGNRAIRDHKANAKRLLLFKALGKGKPYRFLGEQELVRHYETATPAGGATRKAIVFVLRRVPSDQGVLHQQPIESDVVPEIAIGETTKEAITKVRIKQELFRERLLRIERGCRVTGIADLRFLRASHIKPWSKCATGDERVDGNNGLLLAPHVDHLFDGGWISFNDDGGLIHSPALPDDILAALGVPPRPSKRPFSPAQRIYLAYHRAHILRPTRA